MWPSRKQPFPAQLAQEAKVGIYPSIRAEAKVECLRDGITDPLLLHPETASVIALVQLLIGVEECRQTNASYAGETSERQ